MCLSIDKMLSSLRLDSMISQCKLLINWSLINLEFAATGESYRVRSQWKWYFVSPSLNWTTTSTESTQC